MINEQFDDFVKKQVSDQAAVVPPHVIENVIAARKRSRPGGIWFFFTGINLIKISALILLLGAGGYWLYNNNEHPAKILTLHPAITDSVSGAHPVPNTIAATIKSPSNNALQDQDEVTKNHLQPGEQKLNPSSIADVRVAGTKKVSVSGPGVSAAIAPDEALETVKNDIKDDTRRINHPAENSLNKPITEAEKTIAFNRVLFPYTFNNARELKNTQQLVIKYGFPSCPTIEENAAGNKKYWEIYAGPDLPIGNYKTVIPDSASNSYLQKRKDASKITSAFSTGIRYTKVFNNGMSARAGLNYSQINETFRYVNLSEIKLVTVITTRVIVRSPGDTLFINDTLQYQQSGTRIRTTYNHYRTFDIPFVVGYELGNGRLHANINAGIIINVYSWYKGDVLDTSYQPVSITTGKNSPYQFKTNIGVGFLGGVSLYYKLTDRLHLLMEPYFRYNLSPMSKEHLNLIQKYHTLGFRTGLRLDLN